MTWAPHPDLLPDLFGSVHGIKCIRPWMVQCDGCAEVFTSETRLFWAAHKVTFKAWQYGDTRRMCDPCWAAVGVTTHYHGNAYADHYKPHTEAIA